MRRIKKLNQELYDLLGGALIYILNYAKKNNILLPNKNRLEETADRIHRLMIEIDKPVSSDYRIQRAKNESSDGKCTEPTKVMSFSFILSMNPSTYFA